MIAVVLIIVCVVAGVALLGRAPQRSRLARITGVGGARRGRTRGRVSRGSGVPVHGPQAGESTAGGAGGLGVGDGRGNRGDHRGRGAAGTDRGGGRGRGGSAASAASAVDDLAFDLDLVAVCLQAGLPVERALEHAARAAGDRSGLGQLARAARWGLDDLRWEETAGESAAAEKGAGRALASVVAVIRFSARTGVALVPLLQSHADELRRGEHRRRQIAAARLGVMLVLPLGVCVLPAFVLLGVVPVLITLVGDLGPAFGGL